MKSESIQNNILDSRLFNHLSENLTNSVKIWFFCYLPCLDENLENTVKFLATTLPKFNPLKNEKEDHFKP